MTRDDNDRDRANADPEVDWFFENANLNPDRVGCLSQEVLGQLARKERPICDTGYEHLGHCSPCYQQFRRLQSRAVPQVGPSKLSRWLVGAAAALVLVVGGTGVYLWSTHRIAGAGPAISGAQNREIATLDLRPFVVSRGVEQTGRPPLKLSRNDTVVRILLPIGMEPGAYEVRLVDGTLVVTVLDSKAEAVFENQRVSIRTNVSLKNMQAGQYQLALRRSGEDWHFFPTILE